MPIQLVQATVIAMLLFALNDANPYGYYQLLRWACFGVFAYLALTTNKKGVAWTWIFAMLALLYNPLVPTALGREIWEVVNVGTAAVLALSMWSMRVAKRHEETSAT